VTQHLVLMQEELDLRQRNTAVDPAAPRQSAGLQGRKLLAELTEPDILILQALRRVVPQFAIVLGEHRIELGAAR